MCKLHKTSQELEIFYEGSLKTILLITVTSREPLGFQRVTFYGITPRWFRKSYIEKVVVTIQGTLQKTFLDSYTVNIKINLWRGFLDVDFH